MNITVAMVAGVCLGWAALATWLLIVAEEDLRATKDALRRLARHLERLEGDDARVVKKVMNAAKRRIEEIVEGEQS